MAIPVESYVIDDASWRKLYGLDPGGAVVVRPDGFISWRSRTEPNPENVIDALARSVGR